MQGVTYKSTAEGGRTSTVRNMSRKAAIQMLLASAAPLLSIAPAMAQEISAPAGEIAEEPTSSIVVTGSRIVRDGYSAPTPVAVLGESDIAAQSPANISDFVNQLPAIAGSNTSGSSSGGLSSAAAGINSIGLRGLGVGRTLILVDGQRSVASSVGGTVDINTIPQDLVKRVEVITGGASAAYGSDAVGGVVNFILDTGFDGVKLSADTGVSTYGDAFNYRLSGTAGFSLLGDRLHLLTNVSWFHQDREEGINRGWNDSGYFQINNPAYNGTNGQPQRLVAGGIGPSGYTTGGLITSGPLRGTYFLGEGQTAQLTFGTIAGPWMIGGDWKTTLSGHAGTNTLVPLDERLSVFQRVAFDVTPDIEIFGQFSYNRSVSASSYQQTPSTGVSILADNAYLRSQYPAIAATMAARNLPSITIGTSNAGFPLPGSDNKRAVYRLVAGAKGNVSLFGSAMSWDAYYQKGVTKTREALTNTWQNARMALAQDAVFAPDGRIVCRSTLTNPANGCVPIDRLGTEGPSQEALDYIFFDGFQPLRHQTIKQDVAASTLSGDLFALPAGDVAFATGVEWRREQINGEVDPVHNSGWLYGNYRVNQGKYDVYEGFLELSIPIFDGMNLDAAARGTHYSTSGWVGTWKFGASYQIFEALRLRGNISHDIRAPNLEELFAAGTARTNSVIIPAGANTPVTGSQQFVQNAFGNPNLKPEVADSWTVGAVFTPPFLPGFSASFDYYAIDIDDAIGSVTAQQTVDLCYDQGIAAYCPNIKFVNGALSTIDLTPINFATQKTRGFDIEASYSTPIGPGELRLHSQVTHYIKNVIDDGISFPIDYAGVLSAGTYNSPNWVYRLSAFYEIDPVTFNLVARGFTSGTYGNDWIECDGACPASTSQFRTINNNRIDGATYFDASVDFEFQAMAGTGHLTFIVNNLLNKDPVLVGNGPDGNNVPAFAQTNRSRFDVVGRSFRVAAKIQF
ncbi:MAG: TonB-dependent receptor [Sphingopyxis sp.]|nr:TonB-dependent receptor [Sphingopyxis sp.]